MQHRAQIDELTLAEGKTKDARFTRLLQSAYSTQSDCSYQDEKTGDTALHITLKNHDQTAVNFLTEIKNNGLDVRDKEGRTPLHLAVLQENEALVKKLLDKGASPDTKDAKDDTPIISALKIKNANIRKEIAKAILEKVKKWHLGKEKYINHIPKKKVYETALSLATWHNKE